MRATLARFAHLPLGTLGHFRIGGLHFISLEDPWRGNMAFKSCIPLGEYEVRATVTPKHGNTWEVMNVPDRTAILIHVGNSPLDTEGCILLGRGWAVTKNMPSILDSRASIGELREALADIKSFTLSVQMFNPYK